MQRIPVVIILPPPTHSHIQSICKNIVKHISSRELEQRSTQTVVWLSVSQIMERLKWGLQESLGEKVSALQLALALRCQVEEADLFRPHPYHLCYMHEQNVERPRSSISAQCSPVNVSCLRAPSQLLYKLPCGCVENPYESPLWARKHGLVASQQQLESKTHKRWKSVRAGDTISPPPHVTDFLRCSSYPRALQVESDAAQRALVGGDVDWGLLRVGQVHYLHMAWMSPGEGQQRVVTVGTQHTQTWGGKGGERPVTILTSTIRILLF